MKNENQDKKLSKYDEAKGLFWASSLFVGALITVIMGFKGNMRSDWIFAILVGGCVFLALGLVSQGIITLLKRNN